MIASNKLRSFLSMLGVLIGVACVITMLALGRGAKESITNNYRAWVPIFFPFARVQ